MKCIFRYQFKIISICVIFLLSCKNQNPEQDQQLIAFYEKLSEQIHSEKFMPLSLANDQKVCKEDFLFEQDKNNVVIKQGEKSIQLLLSPIELSYENQNHKYKNTYSINIFTSNGKVVEVAALKTPKKELNSIVFSSNIKGTTVKITPCQGNLKWQIVNDFSEKVDSIVLSVKSLGPFYGGGERFMSSCLDERTISNQPNDHYFVISENAKLKDVDLKKYEPSYIQVPFVLNPHGQGWYFDGSESIFMEFAQRSFKTTITGNSLHFFSFLEDNPKDVLKIYSDLMGRQPELPEWAHGVWINLLGGQDSVLAKATRLKDWKMPATAIWIFDMDEPVTSTGWPYWTRGIYNNYREMTDSIHSLGFKALTYLRPFGYKDLLYYKFKNPVYQQYDTLGLILKPKNKLNYPRFRTFMSEGQYNFYDPKMGKEWAKSLTEILIKDNFDGWMEDFGDIAYSYDTETKAWQSIDFGLDLPLTDNQFANVYPLIYHKLSYELTKVIKPDIATFCRSGSAGSAAYTRIVWGGDQIATWDKEFGFPSVITAGISCGLSGYSNWCPDILCNSPSVELWKRWVQFAAFTPLMRDHLWENKNTSVNIWTSLETFNYFKRYAEIHNKLLPYILKMAKKYRETGTPIIRHMMLEFPSEKETYLCEYQYMFGDKYLVAPVVEENALTKQIFFPKGKWKYFWDNNVLESKGEWIEVKAPLEYIPVYERL